MTEFEQANAIAVKVAIRLTEDAPEGTPTHVLMLATSILDVMNHRTAAGGELSRETYLQAAGATYDALDVLLKEEP